MFWSGPLRDAAPALSSVTVQGASRDSDLPARLWEDLSHFTTAVVEPDTAAMTEARVGLEQLVVDFFGRMRAGDRVGARALWAPDAVWHITGSHHLTGDYQIDAYMDLLSEWYRDHPDYRGEWVSSQSYGDDFVVAYARTTGGDKPGTATALAVYRVADGLLQEGWALFADPRYPA